MTPTSVRDVVDLYLTHTKRDQADRTYAGRQRTLLAFVAVHGDLPLADARPFHLRLWIDTQTQWVSDWTRKGGNGCVQRAFNWAVKLGMIASNPFRGVTQREGSPGRPMTDAEFRSMLRASSTPFRRVLTFLRYSGCRPCELSAIEPGMIDFERGIVSLDKHKTAKQRKVRKPRTIVLHPINLALLKTLVRQMVPEQTKVFINSRGNAWTRYALASRVKQLRKRVNIPPDCKLYGLRYALASRALHQHLDLKTLSVLLGHSSIVTTQRYCRIDGDLDHLSAAMKQVFNGVNHE